MHVSSVSVAAASWLEYMASQNHQGNGQTSSGLHHHMGPRIHGYTHPTPITLLPPFSLPPNLLIPEDLGDVVS